MKKLSTLLIIVILTSSCGIGGKRIVGFQNYRKEFTTENTKIKYDGVYYSVNDSLDLNKRIDILIFKKNGYCIKSNADPSFFNQNTISDELENNYLSTEFHQNRDTLLVEYFARNSQTYYSSYVIREWYKILSDSVIVNFKNTYYLGSVSGANFKTIKRNDTLTYFRYIDFNFDHEQWYHKKKWYQEGLHKSRRKLREN